MEEEGEAGGRKRREEGGKKEVRRVETGDKFKKGKKAEEGKCNKTRKQVMI